MADRQLVAMDLPRVMPSFGGQGGDGGWSGQGVTCVCFGEVVYRWYRATPEIGLGGRTDEDGSGWDGMGNVNGMWYRVSLFLI